MSNNNIPEKNSILVSLLSLSRENQSFYIALIVVGAFAVIYGITLLNQPENIEKVGTLWGTWVGAVIGYFFGSRPVESLTKQNENLSRENESKKMELETEKTASVAKDQELKSTREGIQPIITAAERSKQAISAAAQLLGQKKNIIEEAEGPDDNTTRRKKIENDEIDVTLKDLNGAKLLLENSLKAYEDRKSE